MNTSRSIGYFFLLASSLLFVSSLSVGQTTGVKGRVLDVNGAVIPGMEIAAINDAKKVFRVVTADAGEFSLALPIGEYTVEIGNNERSPFCPVRIKNFLIPKFSGFIAFDIILKNGKCFHCDQRCKLKTIEFEREN